jgi:hypothetical protein
MAWERIISDMALNCRFYMPAIEFSQEMDPENLIQMGLLMRFSGITTIIFFFIIIQQGGLPTSFVIPLIIVGLISIPLGYLMGNRILEEGKSRLQEQISQDEIRKMELEGKEEQ